MLVYYRFLLFLSLQHHPQNHHYDRFLMRLHLFRRRRQRLMLYLQKETYL
jgi:hypothetical protein